VFLALAILAGGAGAAVAQEYPNRPIRFVVPSTPGITSDVLARLLGPKISQRWNVPVIVDNKAGAGGIIGADAVAKAEPDGYTFLIANTSFSTLAALNRRLPYDPVKSFASVSLLSSSVMTLVAYEKFPASNFPEFVEQIKKQRGVLNYSSPGTGTTQHLAMELIKQRAGIDMLHVPYKGSSGALSDLVAGHVQASVVALQTAAPFIESGRLKLLAVLGPKRVAQFPNVATLSEAGLGDMVVETWSGVMAPAGTRPFIIAKMNSEMDELLKLPEIRDAMLAQGVTPVGGKPERLDQLVSSELRLWSDVVTRGRITDQ
jgi:tripartite-type tricarboxylate transporter receptor subunit TctC